MTRMEKELQGFDGTFHVVHRVTGKYETRTVYQWSEMTKRGEDRDYYRFLSAPPANALSRAMIQGRN